MAGFGKSGHIYTTHRYTNTHNIHTNPHNTQHIHTTNTHIHTQHRHTQLNTHTLRYIHIHTKQYINIFFMYHDAILSCKKIDMTHVKLI